AHDLSPRASRSPLTSASSWSLLQLTPAPSCLLSSSTPPSLLPQTPSCHSHTLTLHDSLPIRCSPCPPQRHSPSPCSSPCTCQAPCAKAPCSPAGSRYCRRTAPAA